MYNIRIIIVRLKRLKNINKKDETMSSFNFVDPAIWKKKYIEKKIHPGETLSERLNLVTGFRAE